MRRLAIAAFLAGVAAPACAQSTATEVAAAPPAVTPAALPDSPIDLFYVARNQAPIWLRDDAGRAAVQAFAAILRNAALDGLPDGPERNALYEKMVKLICVYVPWLVETYKQETILMQPWLLNYRKHPFMHEPWRYLDIDLGKQPRQ